MFFGNSNDAVRMGHQDLVLAILLNLIKLL